MIRASAPVRFPVNELSAVTGHGSPIRLHAARIDLLTPVPFETRSIPSSLAATHRGFTLITRTARARASYPSCVAVPAIPGRICSMSLASLRLHSPWQITILSPSQLRFRFDGRPS